MRNKGIRMYTVMYEQGWLRLDKVGVGWRRMEKDG